jgi:uncharacterized protein
MEAISRLASPLLYRPVNPAGFALGLFLVLALALLYMIAQAIFGVGIAMIFFTPENNEQARIVKATIIATLPAALVAVALARRFARVRGGDPAEVLSLRNPGLSSLQWIGLIAGFLIGMWTVLTLVMVVFQIDPAQYTPGPDGSSPSTGSAGLVKEAMFALVHEPVHFFMALAGVAIGAPLAEEVIFRGQLFAVLARSPVGNAGAVLITAALWSLLHATEPWLSIGLIFIMGLILGLVLLRFGSLWVTMVLHGAWNATYSLIIFSSLGP